MPHRKSLSLFWRKIPERYNLKATNCETCGAVYFPLRQFCPVCRRRGKIEEINLSGEGCVYSYTVVRTPSEGFELYAPYVLAIIEFKEGTRVTGQLTDIGPEDVEIGMPVKAVFRKITEDGEDGIIHYGYKFVKA
jgi:uncharacterized OB-fold protein